MVPFIHSVLTILGGIAAAAWVYLAGFRGAFWVTSRYHDLARPNAARDWPKVVAIVPARDEAAGVGDCVRSILTQQYAGDLSMILIDDQSSDGTARVAMEAASAIGAASRLTVVSGEPLPSGWTGKLWAVRQGISHAQQQDAPPFLLLTDADIVYEADVVARLVAHAQSKHLVLTSVMAQLRRISFAERLLVPAFVYFFQMLYPFSWARRPDCATAAAAGGCMLVRREALQQAGGIESIRGALIDDCALAARLKQVGPIWLGFCSGVKSTRASQTFGDVGRMVMRSAYAQLRYSPLLLAATAIAMILIFVVPPFLAIGASGFAWACGLASWIAMVITFYPTLHDYESSGAWGLALPAIAAIYTGFTLAAAWQHARGRGGMWKGRAQAQMVRPS